MMKTIGDFLIMWRWRRTKHLILCHMMADNVPLWKLKPEPLRRAIAGMAYECAHERTYAGDVAKHWAAYYSVSVMLVAKERLMAGLIDNLGRAFDELGAAGVNATEAILAFGRAVGEQKWFSRS